MAHTSSSSSSSSPPPSPLVPFFLVATMVAMAFLPWLRSYAAAVLSAVQQVNGAVFLWPLFLILGISTVSAYHKWMTPPSPNRVERGWKASDEYEKAGGSDGISGAGLFLLLVFALVLIPWR